VVSLPPLPGNIDPALRSYLQGIEAAIKDLPGQKWRIIEGQLTQTGPTCLLLQYSTGGFWVTKKSLQPDGTWI
jgi:hypothetical protein